MRLAVDNLSQTLSKDYSGFEESIIQAIPIAG